MDQTGTGAWPAWLEGSRLASSSVRKAWCDANAAGLPRRGARSRGVGVVRRPG